VETARPAGEWDLPELLRLWRDAVSDLDGQRGGGALAGSLARPDLEAFLTGALADSERLLVVGLIDEVVVGLASLVAERDRREPLGRLELIYVEPSARQVGVAAAMLGVAEERCRLWGMAGMDAPALPGNRSAKSFFEVNGMQARLLIMHRPLPSPGGAGGSGEAGS
jgi:GNAT superfamily N-acetyltransferase